MCQLVVLFGPVGRSLPTKVNPLPMGNMDTLFPVEFQRFKGSPPKGCLSSMCSHQFSPDLWDTKGFST